MPTARSRARLPGAVRSGLTLALALLLALTGCSLLSDDDAGPSADASTAPAPGVQAGLRAALDQRAQAGLSADAHAFLSGLAPHARALRRQQRTYYANLTQL